MSLVIPGTDRFTGSTRHGDETYKKKERKKYIKIKSPLFLAFSAFKKKYNLVYCKTRIKYFNEIFTLSGN